MTFEIKKDVVHYIIIVRIQYIVGELVFLVIIIYPAFSAGFSPIDSG